MWNALNCAPDGGSECQLSRPLSPFHLPSSAHMYWSRPFAEPRRLTAMPSVTRASDHLVGEPCWIGNQKIETVTGKILDANSWSFLDPNP
jgi:hypothetical protein